MVSRVEPQTQAPILPAAKVIKPLLRRSTMSGLVRKIDEVDMNSNMLSSPSSPRKRARVTFNPEVEEKVVEEYCRSLDSVRREVKLSLEAHIRGTSDSGYQDLKQIFEPRKRDDEERLSNQELRRYVLALTSQASLLGKSCVDLVQNLLALEWIGRDEKFVRSYIQFLGSLASTQGANVIDSILNMLVDHFLGVRFSMGRVPGCPDVTREELMSRIHSATKFLLHLIPSASKSIAPLLALKFPSDDDNQNAHTTYIRNLIQLTEYAPELTSEVLSITTDRLVKIDVQMQNDLEDVDDDVTALVVRAMSENATKAATDLEEDMSDESDYDSDSTDEDIPLPARKAKQITARVEKMDAILDQLFSYYEPYFSDPSRPKAKSLFNGLMQHFKTIILPIYASRHTQFLLFHYAQKSPDMIDTFAGTCCFMALDATRAPVLQQSAAAYVASFVARGRHVSTDVVRTVFDAFGSRLNSFAQKEEAKCRGPNLQRYTIYYTMTQALIYIFCFRWRDLIEPSELLESDDPIAFINQDFTWIPGIREALSHAIYSKFNPLKVCCPPIIAEFAKIARHLRFMYIYPLLEKNERIRLSQFAESYRAGGGLIRDSGVGTRGEGWHQLDAQFPFDPYQLPGSKHWVVGDYVEWAALPGLEEEDCDSEDDESDEEDNTATDTDDEDI
ncbi:RNA polymerase I-specific transcription initiation factor-like protein rrn3 [Calycina marina]|uniref:RNA polymerase I-specific transcription initiation factor-like protein rrn3 n=1 Tax=Calycina marina TaxID=1763456 RepID=A0A9P8CKS2_9HELO|nr:RNA polymerase I-specific transcription initiation factor-like protein rrn3 [Calycina marina]